MEQRLGFAGVDEPVDPPTGPAGAGCAEESAVVLAVPPVVDVDESVVVVASVSVGVGAAAWGAAISGGNSGATVGAPVAEGEAALEGIAVRVSGVCGTTSCLALGAAQALNSSDKPTALADSVLPRCIISAPRRGTSVRSSQRLSSA